MYVYIYIYVVCVFVLGLPAIYVVCVFIYTRANLYIEREGERESERGREVSVWVNLTPVAFTGGAQSLALFFTETFQHESTPTFSHPACTPVAFTDGIWC